MIIHRNPFSAYLSIYDYQGSVADDRFNLMKHVIDWIFFLVIRLEQEMRHFLHRPKALKREAVNRSCEVALTILVRSIACVETRVLFFSR